MSAPPRGPFIRIAEHYFRRRFRGRFRRRLRLRLSRRVRGGFPGLDPERLEPQSTPGCANARTTRLHLQPLNLEARLANPRAGGAKHASVTAKNSNRSMRSKARRDAAATDASGAEGGGTGPARQTRSGDAAWRRRRGARAGRGAAAARERDERAPAARPARGGVRRGGSVPSAPELLAELLFYRPELLLFEVLFSRPRAPSSPPLSARFRPRGPRGRVGDGVEEPIESLSRPTASTRPDTRRAFASVSAPSSPSRPSRRKRLRLTSARTRATTDRSPRSRGHPVAARLDVTLGQRQRRPLGRGSGRGRPSSRSYPRATPATPRRRPRRRRRRAPRGRTRAAARRPRERRQERFLIEPRELERLVRAARGIAGSPGRKSAPRARDAKTASGARDSRRRGSEERPRNRRDVEEADFGGLRRTSADWRTSAAEDHGAQELSLVGGVPPFGARASSPPPGGTGRPRASPVGVHGAGPARPAGARVEATQPYIRRAASRTGARRARAGGGGRGGREDPGDPGRGTTRRHPDERRAAAGQATSGGGRRGTPGAIIRTRRVRVVLSSESADAADADSRAPDAARVDDQGDVGDDDGGVVVAVRGCRRERARRGRERTRRLGERRHRGASPLPHAERAERAPTGRERAPTGRERASGDGCARGGEARDEPG